VIGETGLGSSNTTNRKRTSKARSILELTCNEAHAFFLEPESYCSIDLPNYFRFDKLLKVVSKVLTRSSLKQLQNNKPRDYDNVNHSLYNNKDGKYAWRPLQIIHPAIYVSLVNAITAKSNWGLICDRFRDFQSNERIRCLSIPLRSDSRQSNRAEQITSWWQNVEQESLELSISYDYTIHTDIVDCYGAIYTHSIAWALHTKAVAKDVNNRRDQSLIGNVIDSHIQDMRYGQTNGLPQGSALMDFIAEMVLGYADMEISESPDVPNHRLPDSTLPRRLPRVHK
jgi:RNA-directed DNA polymerase